MTEQAAIGHVQSQCQGWIAIEKRRERKKGSAEGEEKKLLTQKKLELEEEEGGGVGVGVREGGGRDLWGRFITTQRCPGEAKEEGWGERGKTFPFPFLSFCLYRSHTGGGELCLRRGEGLGWKGGGGGGGGGQRNAAWS